MTKYLILFFISISLFHSVKGQDSAGIQKAHLDSVHSPKISTIAGAILPSAGHIYNQIYKIDGQRNNLWWKLPIIYGGLGASAYFIGVNHQNYKMFKDERIARLDASYNSGDLFYLSDSQLKVYQDQYERWRNLSVIGGLLVYTLQIIDANVEGHLMHFDSSDDLTIDWSPKLFQVNSNKFSIAGISLRISFR